ncbi:hypothetical protein LAB1_25630 [Roseibium sp. LAB1]
MQPGQINATSEVRNCCILAAYGQCDMFLDPLIPELHDESACHYAYENYAGKEKP